MSDDIGYILNGWPRESGDEITVRLIDGDDGTPKIQMRIDMGVIQFERDGNPDGTMPGGYESMLDLYEHRQREHEAQSTVNQFTLGAEDTKKLRDESIRYYYRYLSLMKLGDYERVIRDTERNLRLFSFVKTYAARELDRWMLDQYRPYVIMVCTQAKASLLLATGTLDANERIVDICNSGIADIIYFYKEYGLTDQVDDSLELSILKTLQSQFITDKTETLQEKLDRAISEERFEDAARIRDEINRNS